MQRRYLCDLDPNSQRTAKTRLNDITASIRGDLSELAARINNRLANSEQSSPRNVAEVRAANRSLIALNQQFLNAETNFRTSLEELNARQYRIVNPDASQKEIEQNTSDTSHLPIFTNALMKPKKGPVETRHEDIQGYEKDVLEIFNLFEHLKALVEYQEPAVTHIEQKGEQLVEDIQGAEEHLKKGVMSARARNRTRWWCLLICGKFAPSLYYQPSMT